MGNAILLPLHLPFFVGRSPVDNLPNVANPYQSSTSLFLVPYGIVSNMARSFNTFSAYIEVAQC